MNAVQSALAARSLRVQGARTMTKPPESDAERHALQRSIGANLKRARRKAGLTQRGLVALVQGRGDISLTQQHLAEIEKGAVNPRAHTMAVLAETLGVPVCTLFGKGGDAGTEG